MTKKHLRYVARSVLLSALALPALAANPGAGSDSRSLLASVATYTVECPLPGTASCVIRKPVSTSYRVLSGGVSLEDRGDLWIADFGKPVGTAKKDASGKMSASVGSNQHMLLSILGVRGDLHEIDVQFAKASGNRNQRATKDAVKPTPIAQ